jgi:hypothetical protein
LGRVHTFKRNSPKAEQHLLNALRAVESQPATPSARERAAYSAENICLRMTGSAAGNDRARYMTYVVTARNAGGRDIADVRISVPLAPGMRNVQSVTFSDRRMWVGAVTPDRIELRLDTLGGESTATATLRLGVDQSAITTEPFSARARLVWEDTLNAAALSNNVAIEIGSGRVIDAEALTMTAQPKGSTMPFVVSRGGFAAYETISLWYAVAGGSPTALARVPADANGNLSYPFSPAAHGLAPGSYTLEAYGNCSQSAARVQFTVAPE